jgi:hypothetical protein
VLSRNFNGAPITNGCFTIDVPDPSGGGMSGPFCDFDDGNVDGSTTYWQLLAPGTYTVRPAEGTGFFNAQQQVVIAQDQDVAFVTFTRPQMPSVIFSVKTADDQLVPGYCVTFNGETVCDSAGASDGYVEIYGLAPGTYEVSSIYPPFGHVVEFTSPLLIDYAGDGAVSHTFTVTPIAPRLTIALQDQAGNPATGSCFRIYNAETDQPIDFSCDETDHVKDGHIRFVHIPAAVTSVTVEQTGGERAYVLIPPFDEDLEAGSTLELTLTAEPIGEVVRVRAEDAAGNLLRGACYLVR